MTNHKHWQNHTPTLVTLINQQPFGLITDIDGTISPIAPTPEQAVVNPTARQALSALQKHFALVAAVSGRAAADAQRMLDLPGVTVVGSHGLERWRDGQTVIIDEALPYLDSTERALQEVAALMEQYGVQIEPKGITASLHYRNAPDRDNVRVIIYPRLLEIAERHGLELFEGRYVIELHPPLEVNKGTAIRHLAEEFSLRGMLFLGDDVTDLNGFRAIHTMRSAADFDGLALGVLSDESPPQVAELADMTLNGVPDVGLLLQWMLDNVG